MKSADTKRVALATLGVALSFLVFGYCDSLRGASLPNVMQTFGIGYAAGGGIMIVHFTGYCSASLILGALSGRLSKRTGALIGNVIIVGGILLYINTHNFALFLVAVLAIGFTLGLYEFVGNTIILDVFPENKRGKYANIVAGMHGIGAITAPLIFGKISESGGGYRDSFNLILPVILFAVLLFALLRYPKKTYLDDKPLGIITVLRAFADKNARKYYAMAVVYIAAEAGMGTWLVTYLQDKQQFATTKASFWLSLFFLFLTLGRFCGSFVVDKIDYTTALRAGFLLSSVCILLGILFPQAFLFCLPLSALFMSILFPTLAAAMSVECKKNTSVVMGAFYAFAAIGGAVGSWTVGQMSQIFGVTLGISAAFVFAFIGFLIAKLYLKKEPTTDARTQ